MISNNNDFGPYNVWNKTDLPYTATGVPQFSGRMLGPLDTTHLNSVTVGFFDGSARPLNLRNPGDFPTGLINGKDF